MRRSGRGYSLIEIMVVLLFVGMLMGAALLNGSTSGGRSSNRAVAMQLAQAIQEARTRAISRQHPVGLAFSGAVTQSWYLVEGEQSRIQAVTNLAREYPHSCLFVGVWGTPDATPVDLGGREDTPAIADWPLPDPAHAALLFAPDGSVTGHLLQRVEGKYCFVVAQGVACSGGGPGTARLDQAAHPETVAVAPTGEVSTSEGVLGGPGIAVASALPIPAVSAPPAPPNRPAQPPVPDKPSVLPEPIDDVCRVARDDCLTLTVNATSPERVPLYIEWKEDGDGPKGTFAQTGSEAMLFSPGTGKWVAQTHWRAPAGNAAILNHRLYCVVRDDYGNQATTTQSAQQKVTVSDNPQRLNYAARDKGQLGLFSMQSDGSRRRTVAPAIYTRGGGPLTSFALASWSPDGERVAYVTARGLSIRESDGTAARTLMDGSDLGYPIWSPDGTKLSFTRYNPVTHLYDIYIANADGSGSRNLSNTPLWEEIPDYHGFTGYVRDWFDSFSGRGWSPDSKWVIFYSRFPSLIGAPPTATVVAKADMTLDDIPDWFAFLSPAGSWWSLGFPSMVSYSPDSSQLCYTDPFGKLMVCNADHSNLHQVASDALDARWSPDGTRIVYTNTREHNLWGISLSSPGNPIQLTNGYEDRVAYWVDAQTISFFHHYPFDPNDDHYGHIRYAQRDLAELGDLWLVNWDNPLHYTELTHDHQAACFYGWSNTLPGLTP